MMESGAQKESRKVKRVEWDRRGYEKKKRVKLTKGQCLYCDAPVVEGLMHCAEHRELNRSRNQGRRDRKKGSSACLECNSPALEGRAYCVVHNKKHQKSCFDWRVNKLAKGICSSCRNEIGVSGSLTLCPRCLLVNNLSSLINEALRKKKQAKDGQRSLSLVKFSIDGLREWIEYWKKVQGIEGEPFDIHHINYRSESLWNTPGDKDWEDLWELENHIPLKVEDHMAVHRGDFKDIHPEVVEHIKKVRRKL